MQEICCPQTEPPAPPSAPTVTESSILPEAATRALVSAAVHGAVCARTESNGFGHCAVYAAVGMMVMSKLTGRRYSFQVGDIHIRLSEAYRRLYPDGCTHFAMLGSPPAEGAPSRAAGPFPEFHAWFGANHPAAPGDTSESRPSSRAELIDLSARHYAAHVNGLDPFWRPPQNFAREPLWTTGDRIPDWLSLVPNERATRDVVAMITTPRYALITGRAIQDALEELAAHGLREGSLGRGASATPRAPRPGGLQPARAPDLISAIEI